MKYRVIVLPNARANLTHYAEYAAKNAPLTAARWLDRFHAALESLGDMPLRYPLAPESKDSPKPLHQMLFGKRPNVFRVFFTVEDDEVRVLHVRRASMDKATDIEIYCD
jgi:plasmid stabilization system protein ParE